MAEEMSDYEDKLSFDLIIEPSDQLKHEPDELNSLYEDCVSAIRKTNPTRIIFIAPRKLSHPDTLCDLMLNYFINRSTNAHAESLNSKLKGFRAQLRGVQDLPFFMFRASMIFG